MTRHTVFLAASLMFHGIASVLSAPPTTSVTSLSGEGCSHTVYEGGDGTVNIEPIPTIAAAVPSCAIVEALGGSSANFVRYSPHIANAMMHATNAVKGFTGKLAEVAPKLAPVLGLLGVGLGFINQLTQVTPAQIIAETNKAFERIVNEMNHRLDLIVDYVDQQDISLHKQIINDFYRGDQDRWRRAVQFTTRALVDEQQRIVETSIYAHRHLYMNRAKFVSGGDLSAREIQTLEMQLVSLKNHVDLHLMSLGALITTYKDGNSEGGLDQWRQYKRNFIDYGTEYVSYVKWARDRIYEKRVRNLELSSWHYKCNEPQRHNKIVNQYRVYLASTDQTCSFACNTFPRPRKCEASLKFQCHNYCTAFANVDVQPLRDLMQRKANEVCRQYIRNLKQDVDNFWKKEIFNVSMPLWEEAIRVLQEEEDLGDNQPVSGKARNLVQLTTSDEERNELDEKITQGLSSTMPMNEYLEHLLENYKSLEVKEAIKKIGGENGRTDESENEYESDTENEKENETENENENETENENDNTRLTEGVPSDENKRKKKKKQKKQNRDSEE